MTTPRYDGAAPYYGVGIGLKQQVYGHDINAVTAPAGEDVVLAVSQCVLFDAEHPGYGGTGDVRIQYGGIEAPLIGGGGHHGGDKGLAYTIPWPLTMPMTFFTLLNSLSCSLGISREPQSFWPQLLQSWLHSLIFSPFSRRFCAGSYMQ